jgi:hypothetical protein
VRVGTTCPKGFLPVFSCDTKKEAHDLIVATCSRDLDGNYYSEELAKDQSLETLERFSQKLERVYALMKEREHGT